MVHEEDILPAKIDYDYVHDRIVGIAKTSDQNSNHILHCFGTDYNQNNVNSYTRKCMRIEI